MRDDVERSAAPRTTGAGRAGPRARSTPPAAQPVPIDPATCSVRDVSAVPADLDALDTLARARLEARRRGVRLVLRGASDDLRCLLELAGLADVLEVDPPGPPGRPRPTGPREPED